ncbi:MAG TPA: protein translocase subunit SecD [Candidatus Baltobacteraceae bacterium]|jgi:preprotein translocase subunit SecD|nr:protein translocase subunit SecD [Candidatus Baltobacteraceae bacterium]
MSWNKYKNPIKALVVIAITALSLWAALPVQKKINLGLDLVGGAHLLLQLNPTQDVPQITPEIQQETMDTIDRRINGLGVAEPQIAKVNSNRISVDLPHVSNTEQAEKAIKQAAVLEYKIVPADVNNKAMAAQAACTANPKDKKACDYVNAGAYEASGKVVYQGKDLKSAQASFDTAGNPAIDFTTKDPKKFYDLTSKNLGKDLGMFLDKRYLSAPVINGAISSNGIIQGQFTQDDTIALANNLNSGALRVTPVIIENETIGPTLGKIDLEMSLRASMLGLGLVLVFMIVVYRLPGFLADVALLIYVVMMLAILSISHATLTLPGIAGFVLSIGMAVDANVLIFERIKEELWSGKTMRASVATGFRRAMSAVLDSHVTTIVGAFVLFQFGTGTVKGFAFTLMWGTILSLVTAVLITRFFVDVLVDNDIATSPSLYGVNSEDVGVFAKSGAGA